MYGQTNYIIRGHKQFKGAKLEENNNIATMFAHCLHIFKLRVLI